MTEAESIFGAVVATGEPVSVAWASTPSIPREQKVELIQAFELGKIIQYRADGIEAWQTWNYLDEVGEYQPQLGDARDTEGAPWHWRVPEQEVVVVSYKVGVLIHPPKPPEAVIARDIKELFDMQAMYHSMRDEFPHMQIAIDKDEPMIERKITMWVLKVPT